MKRRSPPLIAPAWCRLAGHQGLGATVLVAAVLGWAAGGTGAAWGQAATKPGAAAPQASATGDGPAWRELTASQRNALRPLERDWARIDGPRKRKWIEIASRFPSMSAGERTRLQERMAEWARLSPQDRNTARLNFRDAKDVPANERRDRWEAYQSLSEDERRRLAEQAARARKTADPRAAAAGTAAARPADARAPKSIDRSNIVPNPAFAARPKVVAPTTLQARPGATTTPITKRPTPPWHQQPGLPKIVTAPEFVEPNTLLPVVGPQAAGTTPVKDKQRK